jgi:hypothetical protein
MGEMRNAYKILVGKPEGKRSLGRCQRRQEANIKMDLKETGYERMYYIQLAQNSNQWWTLVNMVMNLQFHKGREFLDHLSDSKLFKDTAPWT